MRKLICLSIAFIGLLVFPISKINAQGVGINDSGNPPDPSTILDVSSTTKGFTLPRMTTAQRDAIVNPTQSLQIYNLTTNCLELWANGLWQTVWCAACPSPSAVTASATPTALCEGSTLTLTSGATGATSWSWTGPNGFTSTLQNPTIPSITTAGAGVYTLTASNACGSAAPVNTATVTVNTVPSAPTASTHIPSTTQIVWNWNVVSGAAGYKYNTVNDYGTATDNGASTSYTQTGLTCNTPYTLYVWAYNSCGNSSSITLNQTTSACFTCGGSLIITHTIGTLAPETKTINYGTVSTTLGGTGTKCWITQNLGSNNQATSATDATEAAAGWYWQFNRKQGYKHDGTTRTPNTAWIDPIFETSHWLAVNDPCTIELGAGWRIPTSTEWTNADGAPQNWANYNDTYASVLKLHGAGRLLGYGGNGALNSRGSAGYYWGSTHQDADNGWYFVMGSSYSTMDLNSKANGFSLRCIKD